MLSIGNNFIKAHKLGDSKTDLVPDVGPSIGHKSFHNIAQQLKGLGGVTFQVYFFIVKLVWPHVVRKLFMLTLSNTMLDINIKESAIL